MLRIQDRAECGKDTEIGGEGQCTEKMSTERGDTAHTFLMVRTIGVAGGTAQH